MGITPGALAALAVLQSARRDNWLGIQTKTKPCKAFSPFELPAYNNKTLHNVA
jgi:hypothetical protein